MANPTVSVIIPAINEADHIESAISSAFRAGAEQVIVVDSGSTDQTIERAVSSGATVINAERGRANQQNEGAEIACGEILLFLHADCRLGHQCIEQIWQASARGSQHGAFRQSIDNTDRVYRWLEWGNNLRVAWFSMAYGDQAIWVSRLLFDQVGRFANVPLMEDVKLSEALRRHRRATLLPGPVYVDSRRWQKNGPIRQTIRNWGIIARYKLGVSPEKLRKAYRRHDE